MNSTLSLESDRETSFEIARPSLHDQVVSRLRALLIEGVIPPGKKLNERELCELLKISRTPLREAIKLLASEGLVDLLPNRGAIAVDLTEADVHHAFELLSELEGLAGELACRRITAEELAALQSLHARMLASYVEKDLSTYYQLNASIHRAIIKAAKNPLLERTYQTINTRVQALRFNTNHDKAKWERAVGDHVKMMDALDARDAQMLRHLLTQHLRDKADVVIAQLRIRRQGTAVDA
ncbi:GntR family transcriptional regulator [Bordetella genomosp. 8]|uniref:GntR family transcriptional regulator n=1 Tax=Bordetella genomosp. 8 TaxID=1416806 RepID=A0A1W6YRR6_9BORD|nr:GntR family transcriptional regulator [Bordetella genomosp. 8]ARP83609.1 GntR family transcriptional regulator [Bordetella genomosp. 8]